MRYVITGGSGYIGSRLVDLLSRREDTERIVICDLAPPRGYKPKTEFERLDVRDGAAVRSLLERTKPDALVHLAFILNPSHDEQLMYEAVSELLDSKALSAATYQRLVAQFGLDLTIELITVAGFYGMVATVLKGFDVPTPNGERPFQ